jgi:hypothetical protein
MCVILLCLCLATQAWGQFSVSPGSIVLGSYGQGYELADTIEVTASGAWTVSTNVDWLRFDTLYADKEMFNQYGDTVTTFSGNGNGRFTVKVFHNAGGPEREGTITVESGGAIREISIMQDWGAIEVGGVRYGRRNTHIPFDPSAGVIAKSGNAGYSGNVIIQSTIVHNNRTYNVEYIHADAFRNCGGLTSVEIPNSVTEIGDRAFSGSGITSITIPTSVTEIGNGAFSGCSGLTKLTIPNSVTNLGSELCRGCTSLTSAKIPAPTHSYNAYDDGRRYLIGFDGSYSFWYCPLTTLEVGWDTPPNVYSWFGFGMWADMFSGDLRIQLSNGYITGEVANFNYANCTLIVPQGTKELYAAANVWKNFGANIKEKVSPDSLSFVGAGTVVERTDSIFVTTNVAWQIIENVPWLTVSPMSGNGNDTIVVTAAVNNTGAERTGGFTFAGAIPYGTNDTIRVRATQAYLPNLNVSTQTLPAFGATGTNTPQTVTVTSNLSSWTVTVDSTWIKPNRTSGSGNMTFTVTVEANQTVMQRTGKITVAGGGITREIAVTQAAGAPNLNVSTQTLPAFGATGTNTPQTVTVTSNLSSWTVTVDSTWIKPGRTSGSGNMTFTVTVEANPTVMQRTGKITVAGGGITREIAVTQAAAAKKLEVNPQTFPDFGSTGTSDPQTVNVTSNMDWSVSCTQTWIKPNLTSGSGDMQFTFTVDPNTTINERTGTIAVEGGGIKREIAVAQAASNLKLNVFPQTLPVFGATSDKIIPISVIVTSNLSDWYIFTDSAWIKPSIASGSGNMSIAVTVEPNPVASVRSGKIFVEGIGVRREIIVTQEAGGSTILRFTEGGIHYYAPNAETYVEVVAPETGRYIGTVAIPTIVSYSGKTYTVTTIGAEAFAGSNLTNVTLPHSLTNIGADAFNNCKFLENIEIEWLTLDRAYPTGLQYAFIGVPQDKVTLTVPVGTKSLYKSADFWKYFKIVEKGTTGADKVTTESAITVRASSGRLHVDSPTSETIYIYSFIGKLLHAAPKSSGEAVFDLPAEKLLIVRGSSGWARKLMAN